MLLAILVAVALTQPAIALLASVVPLRPSVTASIGSASPELAFASRRDGNWEIYVTDESGRNQRRLTSRDVEDRFPLWSPNRRQIAFGSLVDGTWELWLMDADGTNQRRLASHIIAKSTRGWSPDGQWIAFAAAADTNADIFIVHAATGRVRRLTSAPGEDRDPSWSPDGRRLTFSSQRDGLAQIYVISADGGGVRRVTTGTVPAEAPRWSPDGASIAFVSNRDLHVVGVDGQNPRPLTAGARVTRDPALWSPDGSRILFQIADGENYDIGLLELSGRTWRRLASSAAYDGSYTWSVGGKQVAFISGRDGVEAVYIANADTQDAAVRLTATASLTPGWGSQR